MFRSTTILGGRRCSRTCHSIGTAATWRTSALLLPPPEANRPDLAKDGRPQTRGVEEQRVPRHQRIGLVGVTVKHLAGQHIDELVVGTAHAGTWCRAWPP